MLGLILYPIRLLPIIMLEKETTLYYLINLFIILYLNFMIFCLLSYLFNTFKSYCPLIDVARRHPFVF